MHDCALGREGKPSAPRVEHIYYAGDGLNGKIGGGGGKIKTILIFFHFEQKFRKIKDKKIMDSGTFNLKWKKTLMFCENCPIRKYPSPYSCSPIVYIRIGTHGESDNE